MSYICSEDYIDQATRTVSSEDAEFPASNLYDQSIRGRVWRSAGNFVVTSANKGIVFQETAGVDITANIAEGTYDNRTDFKAAIKTALEAAGVATYTMNDDSSTFMISITSNLGGGATVFRLMWTDVLSTAYDLLGFDNSGDDTGSATYTADEVRIHSEEWIKWDLGASSNPDIFVAIGKKNQAIKLSNSATIKLQGNATDVWTSPSYNQTLTYDEVSIIDIKTVGDSGLHTTALRYWRLSIVDRENSNGYIELSNVYLGEYYKPTQGSAQFPFRLKSSDFSSRSQFQSGARTSLRRQRSESFSFNWLALTNEEKEEFDSIIENVGTSKPFYMVFDPNEAIGTSVNYNVRYVIFSSDVDMSLDRPNIWSSSWSLDEVL